MNRALFCILCMVVLPLGTPILLSYLPKLFGG